MTSPNAGLRLLSSAISPHIRAQQASVLKLELPDNDEKQTGKRRLFEKGDECRNLEQLVEMFIAKFATATAPCDFSLNDLQFGNGKRRIYDVVNVFEGLGLLDKLQRNQYTWRGLDEMKTHLEGERRRAQLANQNHALVVNIINDISVHELSGDNLIDEQNQSFETSTEQKMNLSTLTAKFVQVFFALRPINNALALDEAAEHLAPAKSASIKRRLYDIINVMLSLGLVEKVQLTFGSGMGTHRKPGYQWKEKETRIEPKAEMSKTPIKKERKSTEAECQTSPSLLKALIRDITLEMNNSTRHEPNKSNLRKVLFSPLQPKGTSTPLAQVKKQSFERKRKSSCPVFSTIDKNTGKLQNITPTSRTRAASVHVGRQLKPKFSASKNLNFTSPIGREMATPRKILPHGGMILVPMSPLTSPNLRLLTTGQGGGGFIGANGHSDSGLGASPAVFIQPNATNAD